MKSRATSAKSAKPTNLTSSLRHDHDGTYDREHYAIARMSMCLDVTHGRHVGIPKARPEKLDRRELSIEENELMAL